MAPNHWIEGFYILWLIILRAFEFIGNNLEEAFFFFFGVWKMLGDG